MLIYLTKYAAIFIPRIHQDQDSLANT